MVAHTGNPSAQEVEAGGYRVQGQPGYIVRLSQQTRGSWDAAQWQSTCIGISQGTP
jgi:hypothetical protein